MDNPLLPTSTHFIFSSLFAMLSSLENPSAQMINRYGLKGPLCLNPLVGLNSVPFLPLKTTEYDTLLIHCKINETQLSQNSRLYIIFSIEIHSILSYALLTSNFKAKDLIPYVLFLKECNSSYATRILSVIYLLGTKAPCVSSM